MAKRPSKEIDQQANPSGQLASDNTQIETLDHAPYQEEPKVTQLREEILAVNKRWVKAGEVHLRKEITERTEDVPYDLTHEEVDIQRVAVNRALGENETAEPRQEGDTLVIPVVEEELVVTKRMVVREEVRITRRNITVQQKASGTVRREELVVDTAGDLTTADENTTPNN
ncbi:MAG: YsnF/AvaK domain-containing protein [Chloroflexota bacterium]